MVEKQKRIRTAALLAVAAAAAAGILAAGVRRERVGQFSEIQYTDKNGETYVAVFLRDLTDSTVTVDVIEFITDDNAARIKELGLTEDDLLDGYYIHDPETQTVTWKLDEETVFTFIDWGEDFTDAGCPEEYTTMNVAEFQKYIDTYDDSQPGMPFFFQTDHGTVRLVLEKPFA